MSKDYTVRVTETGEQQDELVDMVAREFGVELEEAKKRVVAGDLLGTEHVDRKRAQTLRDELVEMGVQAEVVERRHRKQYEGAPEPLAAEDVADEVQPREPQVPLSEVAIDLETLLGSVTSPALTIRGLDNAQLRDGRIAPAKTGEYELGVDLSRSVLGEHVFPERPEVLNVDLDHDRLRHRDEAIPPSIEGFLPEHLGRHAVPDKLSEDLRTKPRIQVDLEDREEGVHEPTTIFGADDRYAFNDTSFPWCTVGRVDTPGGTSSGAMVGPRHLLMASHAVDWRSDGSAGWVKFTPSYFDGSAPFGTAWGTRVYWDGLKVDGSDGINRSEGQHDYVVVVLNTRMGNLTGWMGSRGWSDSWDGGSYWSHIGYPGDLTSAQRPTYQGNISLDGSFWDREVHTRIWHKGDVWPGQSGGPFFGWWSGEPWPRAVSVQSGQNSDENSASGGDHMIDLIRRARNDYP